MLGYGEELSICRETHMFATFGFPVQTWFQVQRRESAVDNYLARRGNKLRPVADDPASWKGRLMGMRDLRDVASAFHDVVLGHTGATGRWGEKTPLHVLHAPSMLALFPDARFVIIQRDLRATAASLSKVPFFWNFGSLQGIAYRWILTTQIARTIEAARPGRLRVIRYEDLVRNPYETIEPLCAFLKMPYCQELVDRPELTSETPTEGLHTHLTTPPNPHRIDAWRSLMSPSESVTLEQFSGGLLTQEGYSESLKPEVIGGGTSLRRTMSLRERLIWLYTARMTQRSLRRWLPGVRE